MKYNFGLSEYAGLPEVSEEIKKMAYRGIEHQNVDRIYQGPTTTHVKRKKYGRFDKNHRASIRGEVKILS